MNIDDIARVAHESNRSYSVSIGEEMTAWEDCSEAHRESIRKGVTLLLKDQTLTPEAIHDKWLAHKINQGWIYGEEKNEELKTHPCIKSYEDLPKEQHAKDHIFRDVVLALCL
jgi:hypothetical protein